LVIVKKISVVIVTVLVN